MSVVRWFRIAVVERMLFKWPRGFKEISMHFECYFMERTRFCKTENAYVILYFAGFLFFNNKIIQTLQKTFKYITSIAKVGTIKQNIKNWVITDLDDGLLPIQCPAIAHNTAKFIESVNDYIIKLSRAAINYPFSKLKLRWLISVCKATPIWV